MKMVLASVRAKEIHKADDPELFRIVENLSITAGIPMPKVYIIPDAALNAFATGRDPEHRQRPGGDGIAIPNVEVSLSGDKETSFFTGNDGRFVFDGLSNKGSYFLNLHKDSNHPNGISAADVILMINHIIGKKELASVFSRFAGDVNQDGNVSSIDLIQVINVIIGRTPMFPNVTSWRFEPENLQMSGSNIGQLEFSVVGYKMGDLNNSANPRF